MFEAGSLTTALQEYIPDHKRRTVTTPQATKSVCTVAQAVLFVYLLYLPAAAGDPGLLLNSPY